MNYIHTPHCAWHPKVGVDGKGKTIWFRASAPMTISTGSDFDTPLSKQSPRLPKRALEEWDIFQVAWRAAMTGENHQKLQPLLAIYILPLTGLRGTLNATLWSKSL